VISAAGEVIKLKGYTNWAIGAAVASIVRCILNDERRVMPLSTLATGRYGITEDIYIALPCVLGRHGIVHTLNVPLNDDEVAKLQKSARTLNEAKVI
jgi:L-lactate dehydrogenase